MCLQVSSQLLAVNSNGLRHSDARCALVEAVRRAVYSPELSPMIVEMAVNLLKVSLCEAAPS